MIGASHYDASSSEPEIYGQIDKMIAARRTELGVQLMRELLFGLQPITPKIGESMGTTVEPQLSIVARIEAALERGKKGDHGVTVTFLQDVLNYVLLLEQEADDPELSRYLSLANDTDSKVGRAPKSDESADVVVGVCTPRKEIGVVDREP